MSKLSDERRQSLTALLVRELEDAYALRDLLDENTQLRKMLEEARYDKETYREERDRSFSCSNTLADKQRHILSLLDLTPHQVHMLDHTIKALQERADEGRTLRNKFRGLLDLDSPEAATQRLEELFLAERTLAEQKEKVAYLEELLVQRPTASRPEPPFSGIPGNLQSGTVISLPGVTIQQHPQDGGVAELSQVKAVSGEERTLEQERAEHRRIKALLEEWIAAATSHPQFGMVNNDIRPSRLVEDIKRHVRWAGEVAVHLGTIAKLESQVAGVKAALDKANGVHVIDSAGNEDLAGSVWMTILTIQSSCLPVSQSAMRAFWESVAITYSPNDAHYVEAVLPLMKKFAGIEDEESDAG